MNDSYPRNPQANQLFRQATELKKAGNLDGAIDALIAAEQAIHAGDVEYSINFWVRLPMYLQAAGRGAEAIDYLQQLLARYPHDWTAPPPRDRFGKLSARLANSRGTIYDKVHLVYLRDKQPLAALPYAVLGWTYGERAFSHMLRFLQEKWKRENKSNAELQELVAAEKRGPVKQLSEDQLDWLTYQHLSRYINPDANPKDLLTTLLKNFRVLLRKAKQLDHLDSLETYLTDLIRDTAKSDEQILAEVKHLMVVEP